MAVEITSIVDGVSIVEEKGEISSATRVFLLDGVTQNTNIGTEVLELTGIPKYGDFYFGDSNVRVESRNWDFSNPNGGQVTVTYKRRTSADQEEPTETAQLGVSFSSTTQQITTEKDLDGNTIFVDPPAVEKASDTPMVAEISVNEAQDTMSIRRIVTTNSPGVLARRYNNKVNSVSFEGDAKGTWRVANVDGNNLSVSSTGAQTWELIFNLINNRLGWVIEAIYWDDENNRPDSRIERSSSKGIKVIDWYESIDLNGIYNL